MSLSTAAIVGMAIGSAVAGALIAVLVWLGWAYWQYTETLRANETEGNYQEARRMFAFALDCFLPSKEPKVGWLRSLRDGIYYSANRYVKQFIDANAQGVEIDESTFAALALPPGEWRRLLEPGADREHIMATFICRFLMSRMAANSDLATTLLPPDIAATYQRLLTMPATKAFSSSRAGWLPWQNDEFPIMLRHYWRSITCYMGNATLPVFKNVPEIEFDAENPCTANVEAAINTIRQTFAPFDVRPEPGNQQSCERAKEELEDIMRNATMMALIAFSCPIPLEYFWPKEAAEPLPPYRRPNTAEAKEHGRLRGRPERSYYHVRCFGIKGFNLVPGTQMPYKEQLLLPSIVVEPMDDHYLSDRRDQMEMNARFHEIDEANRQRAIANQERREAEMAARQAEARRRQELDWV